MTFEQAISFHQQGQLDTALRGYQGLLEKEPNNAQLLRLIAMVYWAQGAVQKTQMFLQQAINIQPDDPVLLSNWGMLWHSLGDVEKAIDIYQRALSLTPSSGVYCNLGSAFAGRQEWNLAGQAFRNAITLDEECWTAWWHLTVVHRENKEYSQAQDCLQVLEENLGDSAQLSNEQGLLAFAKEEWREAQRYFQQALRQTPTSEAEIYCNLALALREEGETNSEIIFQYLEKALELEPDYANSYIHFALLLEQEGEKQGAIGTMEYAAQRFPNNIDIQLHWALMLAQEDRGRAIELMKNLVSLDPKRASLWLQLGHLYIETNDKENAMEAFHKCLQLDAGEAEALYFLAILEGRNPTHPSTKYIARLFDGYAHSFERHLTQELEYQTPTQLMSLLDTHIDFPVADVVDLGCGTGLMGDLLRDKSRTLIGVDLSSKMLDQARKKGCYDSLHCQDIEAFLLEHNDFSLLLAADVFNYFAQLETVVLQSYLALKTDGYLAFSVESSKVQEFRGNVTGRFQHSSEQVVTICGAVGFQLICQQHAKLRKEKGEWVIGVLFLFQKR